MKHPYFMALAACTVFASTAYTQTTPLLNAPLPPARSSLPQLGLSADEQLTLTQERVLGRVLWRDMRSEPDVMTDPLINDYLQTLVNRLAAPLGLPEAITLRAFAVADPALNAFAMPSGLMGVHSGLMLSVAREGELAAVLAHEIGHVSQRHFARGLANQKDNAWIGLAGFAAALLAAKRGNAQADQVMQGVMAGSQAVQASKQLSFSRDMEREADAVGFGLMKEAQFDATDMVRMLRRLGAASSLNETGTVYARSHPGVTERMANVEGRLKIGSASLKSAAPSNDSNFLFVQTRVRAVLAKSPEQADDAKAYFEAQLATAKQAGLRSAAHYGLAMLAQQAKQPVQAQSQLAAARVLAHPWLDALAFELKPDAAQLAEFIARHGTSAVSEHLIDTLLKQNPVPQLAASDLSAVQTLLTAWLAQRPQDDGAWESLAAIYKQQDQVAMASWAQAEQTAAMGVWASSITLLSNALRLGETTVPINTQNQWRERLRELRQTVEDEKALLEKFK